MAFHPIFCDGYNAAYKLVVGFGLVERLYDIIHQEARIDKAYATDTRAEGDKVYFACIVKYRYVEIRHLARGGEKRHFFVERFHVFHLKEEAVTTVDFGEAVDCRSPVVCPIFKGKLGSDTAVKHEILCRIF